MNKIFSERVWCIAAASLPYTHADVETINAFTCITKLYMQCVRISNCIALLW